MSAALQAACGRRQPGVGFCVGFCLALFVAASAVASEQVVMSVHDAFVRQMNPTINYGSAGALNVAGPLGQNMFGETQGRHDTVMQFNTTDAIAAFDAEFGAGGWSLTGIQLMLYEVGMPPNSIFAIGLGDANIAWLSNDNWVEGPGSPFSPVEGMNNEMTWQFLQTMLLTATEINVGGCSNTQENGFVAVSLQLDATLVSDVLSGGPVSLHFTPVTPTLGFTFRGHNFIVPGELSYMVLTASANVVAGDMNCDGTVNLADIDALSLALTDPVAYAAAHPGCNINAGDLNTDGLVNGNDISPFVDLLVGP